MSLDPVYALHDNNLFASALQGYSENEYISFDGYVRLVTVNMMVQIGKDTPGSGAVDVVNITVNYDRFSSTTIRAFVSEYARPVEIRPKQ